MNFYAGVESPKLPSLEISTKWWVDGKPSQKVLGTLVIESGTFTELNIPDGSLLGENESEQIAIQGYQNGKEISLLNLQRISYSGGVDGEITNEKWSVGVVIVGHFASSWRELFFENISVKTHLLSDWAPPVALRPSLNPVVKDYKIEIPADSLLFHDSKFSLKMQWFHREQVTADELILSIYPSVIFSFEDVINFPDAYINYIQPFLNLVSFSTCQVDVITNVSANLCVDGLSKRVELYISGLPAPAGKKKTNTRYRNVIKFPSGSDECQTLFQNWYQLFELHNNSIREYFSISQTGSMYDYQNFPRIIGALEALGSNKFPNHTRISNEDFGLAKEAIRKSLSKDSSMKLLELVKNRPDLHSRIQSLLNLAPEEVREASRIVPDFVRRCVKTRNSLVHVNHEDIEFLGEEVSLAVMILEVFYASLILSDLGFESSNIMKMLNQRVGRMPVIYAANYLHASIELREGSR